MNIVLYTNNADIVVLESELCLLILFSAGFIDHFYLARAADVTGVCFSEVRSVGCLDLSVEVLLVLVLGNLSFELPGRNTWRGQGGTTMPRE